MRGKEPRRVGERLQVNRFRNPRHASQSSETSSEESDANGAAEVGPSGGRIDVENP